VQVVSVTKQCQVNEIVYIVPGLFKLFYVDHELIKRLAVFIGNSSLKSVKLTDVDGFSARSIVTFLMKSLKSNLLEELLIYSSEMSDDQVCTISFVVFMQVCVTV
jgi:hypothetical protein